MAFVIVRQQLAGRGSAALSVVSGTSRQQRSDGSSDGGAAIGIRCDDWLWPHIIIMQKINALQKCSAQVLPGALIFAPGSAFLLRSPFLCWDNLACNSYKFNASPETGQIGQLIFLCRLTVVQHSNGFHN